MRVKALVGIGYLEGELLGVNRQTARIKFKLPGKEPFIIKRHLVKHRIEIVGKGDTKNPPGDDDAR